MWNNGKKLLQGLHRPPGYQPDATLSGQTWRSQLRGNSTSIIINFYQLGTGGRTQKAQPVRGVFCCQDGHHFRFVTDSFQEVFLSANLPTI